MPVSAANVPRRYVGAIGRDANTLREGAWPAATRARLPPLPLPANLTRLPPCRGQRDGQKSRCSPPTI